MMKNDEVLFASEDNINKNRRNYKVGMYFSLSILLIIAIWAMMSEARWMIFDSGVGMKYHYDMWMILGVILTIVFMIASFFTLGQVANGMTKECDLLGGAIHMEERQIIMWWAIIIGMVLGMGFWDIVTEIHLALEYGILNIWFMDVVVFDFGAWQMIIPVWGLVIIGVAKMGGVAVLYVLAIKNMRRGTVCDLASLKKESIVS